MNRGSWADERVSRIAFGEIAPDEYYRRARRRGEDDAPSYLLIGIGGRNPWRKHIPEGEPHWICLMRDLAGPALVEGQADGAVEFKEAVSGQVVEVKTDSATGHFRVMLPEGKYTVGSR
jgi:hypothetical protein